MNEAGLFRGLLTWTGLRGPAGDHSRAVSAAGTEEQIATAGENGASDATAARPAPAPFVPTPLPFAPTRSTVAPAPEPLAAAPPQAAPAATRRATPPPFTAARWLFGPPSTPDVAREPVATATHQPPAPPSRLTPPPWPLGSPPEPVDDPLERAPLPFLPTPLPFASTQQSFDPDVGPVIGLPKPASRSGPRFGQMHAEATARAARFVAAHHAEPAPRAGIGSSAPPAPDAPPGLSPKAAAVMKAARALGVGPVLATAAPPSPALTARAAAFERAMARGRALAESERPPPKPQNEVHPDEITLGVTLILILILEVFGGVVAFALPGSHVVLALGLALDACARTLGTVAAARSGKEWGPGWRWACALLGSPAVVAFAFSADGSLVGTDPAPLAGPIAALATILLVIGLAGIPAGF